MSVEIHMDPRTASLLVQSLERALTSKKEASQTPFVANCESDEPGRAWFRPKANGCFLRICDDGQDIVAFTHDGMRDMQVIVRDPKQGCNDTIESLRSELNEARGEVEILRGQVSALERMFGPNLPEWVKNDKPWGSRG